MSFLSVDTALDLLGGAVILSTVFTIFLVTLPSRYQKGQDKKHHVSVQVVVLGDVGRSPRMQYHALSIAKHGGRVDLIGYSESQLQKDVASNANITLVSLATFPRWLQTSNKILFLLLGPVKVLWQVLSLYYALGYESRPTEWMLVQNPPSIPVLAIAQIACFFRNTKLIIDWHNFGYSILALKLGPSHPLVKLSHWYEVKFAKAAAYHFSVTNAMARVLKEQFEVDAMPLHDRPPAHFQPLTEDQRVQLLERLPQTAEYAEDLQDGFRKLIVSSTSWTPDEDFSLLLEALVAYSMAATDNPRLPRIIAIITGKGPQKEYYLAEIARLQTAGQLNKVDIKTAWLSMEDYVLLLGAADLGVSLHTSSSGVDLPMKVVDMFGTGLPVVGWSKFEAWPELVTEGVNGLGFGSAVQLADLLGKTLGSDTELSRLRKGAMKECGRRWDDEWDPVAGRLLGLVS